MLLCPWMMQITDTRTTCKMQRMAATMVENFESLMLGAPAPGMPEGIDLAQLPRPVGDNNAVALAAQPVCDSGNCSAANMRLTVTGIPNSSSLRSRCKHQGA